MVSFFRGMNAPATSIQSLRDVNKKLTGQNSMRPRLHTFFFVLLLTVIGAREASCAEKQQPTEFDVKAAYIYNFAKFVEWPAGKSSHAGVAITVCVVGEDHFGPALAMIEGKSVGGRKIRIKRESAQHNLRGCDILFISSSEKKRLAEILDAVKDANVLTIGDTKGFAQQGVMINFYMENKTVRFEINPKPAGRAGLRISSNLLKIAKIVGEP